MVPAPDREDGARTGPPDPLHKERFPMMRAIWNGLVIAETPRTKVIEGSHYFPPESLHREFFSEI